MSARQRQWRLMINGQVVDDVAPGGGARLREAEDEARRERLARQVRAVRLGGMSRKVRVGWAILITGAVLEVGLSVVGLGLGMAWWRVSLFGVMALALLLVGVRWNR